MLDIMKLLSENLLENSCQGHSWDDGDKAWSYRQIIRYTPLCILYSHLIYIYKYV